MVGRRPLIQLKEVLISTLCQAQSPKIVAEPSVWLYRETAPSFRTFSPLRCRRLPQFQARAQTSLHNHTVNVNNRAITTNQSHRYVDMALSLIANEACLLNHSYDDLQPDL